MKLITAVFLILAVMVLLAASSWAETLYIVADYTWEPIPNDNIVQPVRFELFKNGQKLCEELNISMRQMICPTEFTSADINQTTGKVEAEFTMTVVDNRGVASISNPVIGSYEITDIPPLLAPVLDGIVISPSNN